MKSGINIVLILIITCTLAKAQGSIAKVDVKDNKSKDQRVNVNAAEEISKIKQVYDRQEELSMDVVYRVFVSHHAANPIELNKGHYQKRGADFESNIEGFVTLQNKNIFLTADPENQMIYVARPAKVKSSLANLPLDTLLSLYAQSHVTQLDKSNNRITLTLLSGSRASDDVKGEYEKIEIYYNPSSYLINKFVLYYAEAMSVDEEKMPKEKPRMEVVFSNLNLKPGFDKRTFSESKFYEENKGKLKGVDLYKDYQVFDQRLKK